MAVMFSERSRFRGFLFGLALFAAPWSGVAQVTPTSTEPAVAATANSEDKFQISFENEEWKNVIEYFADKAGYTLHLRTSNYPPGTWTYHSNDYYTLGEVLDIINHGLRIREDVYTLVRYQKMLILIRERDGYPEDLIETVRPDQLDERGRYETIRCQFDVSDLKDTNIVREVQSIVDDRRATTYLEDTGRLIVQATGQKLRVIRGLIEGARERKISRSQQITTYKLKHVTADELLIVVRSLMGLGENQNQFADGSLTIRPQIFGDKIYLKGTAEKIAEFERIAAVVDIPEEVTASGPKEKPFLKSYPVSKDPLLTFQVVNTMLVGRDVKIDQDKETGTLIVLARAQDHEEINEIINTVNGASSSSATITLQNRTVSSAIEYLNTMFRQTDSETAKSGPVFYGDSSTDTLVILGKPQEIALAQELISRWDLADGLSRKTGRSTTRVIPVPENQAWNVMSMLEDYWPTTNRPNRLNFVLPDQRENLRTNPLLYPGSKSNGEPANKKTPDQGSYRPRNWRNVRSAQRAAVARTSPRDSGNADSESIVAADYEFVSLGSSQDPERGAVGRTSEESQESQDEDAVGKYSRAQEPKSVPGAPITVRLGPAGIVVESADLDAADDMEELINSLLKNTSAGELPTFFYLKYAKADEAKELLDKFLGISSSGGGGGGGLGGMFGGMMSNMLGGAAGDMVSGLLGGGAGGSSSAATAEWLESTNIKTIEDVRLNTIAVVGATTNDLEMISQFIDYIDQAQAPHDPNLIGKTYVIPISFYSDVEALKKMIEAQLKDLIQSDSGGGGAGGGGGQPPEAAMARMVQQAMRGATGGAQQKNADELRPKGRLGHLDRMLIFTGPSYIYDEVVAIVKQVDTPGPQEFSKPEMLYLESMDAVEMGRALKLLIPGIEVEGLPEETSGLAGNQSQSGSGQNQQANSGQNRQNRPGGGQNQQGGQNPPTFQFPANFQFPGFGGGQGGGNRGGQGGNRGGMQGGGNRGGQGGNRGGAQGGFF